MGSQFRIKVAAGLGIVALYVSEAIRTHDFTLPNFGSLGKALTLVGLVAGAYELFLWRFIPFGLGPPVLRGTWKMSLTEQLPAAEPGQPARIEPTAETCYLCIRQSASSIAADLLFFDGKSTVTTAMLIKEQSKRYVRVFYDFEPENQTDDSPRRKGAASLEIVSGELKGKYWNDARTRGVLRDVGRTGKHHKSYDAAVKGKYTPRRLSWLVGRL